MADWFGLVMSQFHNFGEHMRYTTTGKMPHFDAVHQCNHQDGRRPADQRQMEARKRGARHEQCLGGQARESRIDDAQIPRVLHEADGATIADNFFPGVISISFSPRPSTND
jgi:hypothetical protein